MKRLQDWQERTGTGDAALAALAGVERSTIQRAKRGLHSLNIRTQRAIRGITDGEVTPSHWAEHYEACVTQRTESAEEDLRPAGAG